MISIRSFPWRESLSARSLPQPFLLSASSSSYQQILATRIICLKCVFALASCSLRNSSEQKFFLCVFFQDKFFLCFACLAFLFCASHLHSARKHNPRPRRDTRTHRGDNMSHVTLSQARPGAAVLPAEARQVTLEISDRLPSHMLYKYSMCTKDKPDSCGGKRRQRFRERKELSCSWISYANNCGRVGPGKVNIISFWLQCQSSNVLIKNRRRWKNYAETQCDFMCHVDKKSFLQLILL